MPYLYKNSYVYYMYNTIVNPITGRAVNVNGRTGKMILKQYVDQLEAGARRARRAEADNTTPGGRRAKGGVMRRASRRCSRSVRRSNQGRARRRTDGPTGRCPRARALPASLPRGTR